MTTQSLSFRLMDTISIETFPLCFFQKSWIQGLGHRTNDGVSITRSRARIKHQPYIGENNGVMSVTTFKSIPSWTPALLDQNYCDPTQSFLSQTPLLVSTRPAFGRQVVQPNASCLHFPHPSATPSGTEIRRRLPPTTTPGTAADGCASSG